MVTTKFGKKHLCQSCGAKFFDLLKVPPECPKCGAIVEQKSMPKTRSTVLPGAKKLTAKQQSKNAAEATPNDNKGELSPTMNDLDGKNQQDLDDSVVEELNESVVDDLDESMTDDLDNTVMEDTSDLGAEGSGVSGVEEQLDIPSQSKDDFSN